MSPKKTETLERVLDSLMSTYKERVPAVQGVIDAMIKAELIKKGDDIENDHIAFRTLGVPQLGISSLEKIFLYYGYERRDAYHFPEKKLNAFWYAPPEEQFPRIFISELRLSDLSEDAQGIIQSFTDQVKEDPVDQLNLDDADAVGRFLHQPLWSTPSWESYSRLMQESEYAAWAIYNRYYLNHFTVSVHNLPEPYNTIARFNQFLEENGFKLNDSGGKEKVSNEGYLIQSSTVANLIEVPFTKASGEEEIHAIPGSYVEFAERRVLPEFAELPTDRVQRKHRREGFEAANANRIFESTYSTQTQR